MESPSRPTVRVGVLGEVVVWRGDGQLVPLPPQLRRLLAILVAAEGASVSADRIAEHVTDGRFDSSAIRTAISRLRRILGDRVETSTAGYRLRLTVDELDSAIFSKLLSGIADTPPISRRETLTQALDLWRGSALEGMADEPWALGTATRLDEERAAATEDLAEALVACGRPVEAITLLGGLTAAHPYRERPVALLMRALAGEGRLTEALRAYQRLRSLLREDIGLEPSSALRWLEAELLADDTAIESDAGRPASRVRPTGNLRSPKQSFIGRQREVKDLVDGLRSHRLLTLTGVGGVGKTRLSLEVAGASASDFSSGVWVIELAAVFDREAVLHTTMTVLGTTSEVGVTALESIVDVLRAESALIVIDNAEHVLEPVRELVSAILDGCDGPCVMVTSREPLAVPGESVHMVAPLDTFESIDLFCERAREADDRFEYGDDDRAVIEMVAARLDGLPLAIELAAARMRSLTASDLLGGLDDRFLLLQRGRGDSGRHATLHAAVDWSYRLLDDDERAVFDRSGVFASGFDLEAVTAVCADSCSSSLDVAEVVGSLVDKSMVIADCREPGTRYWLLETLRQYALEQLAADDAEQAVRTAHAEHFNALARELRLANEIDDGPTAGTLEREWENFRAALRWALDSGDIDRAASLAANLSMSLDISRDEHQRWVEAVLAVLPKDHRMAAILYCLAGWWANLLGDHNEALRLAHRGLAVGSTSTVQKILLGVVIGEARVHLGQPAEALAAAQDVIALSPVDRDVRLGLMLACWCAWPCQPELVPGYAERLAAIARETDRRQDRHHAAYTAGIVELINDDPRAAMACFRQAQQAVSGVRGLEGEALQGLTLAAAAGNDPGAATIFSEALGLLSVERACAHLWMVLETLAIHWADTGRLVDAATLLGGLDAHGRACVFLVAGRQRAQGAVDTDPALGSSTRRGRSLNRARLLEYAFDQLRVEGAHYGQA